MGVKGSMTALHYCAAQQHESLPLLLHLQCRRRHNQPWTVLCALLLLASLIHPAGADGGRRGGRP